ncbi:hypothetical protein [Ferribacterium limneticum]|uniref:hypothetical protein n=1 Tax=Ferribacterium limneticum TaxID=76259 RepID=UPI001CF9A245|nr:hypothetical protein [Ferribacterium limneticum]UCV20777.1 hypothetical protein KI610_09510 [Ferribacterium limneticum]
MATTRLCGEVSSGFVVFSLWVFHFVIHLRPPIPEQPGAVAMTMQSGCKHFRALANIHKGNGGCVRWRTEFVAPPAHHQRMLLPVDSRRKGLGAAATQVDLERVADIAKHGAVSKLLNAPITLSVKPETQ